MKAVDRCTENFQGDRCLKPKHHHYSTALEADPVHHGKFTMWRGEVEQVILKRSTPANSAPRRNREIRKALRSLKQIDLSDPANKAIIDQMIRSQKR